MTERILQGPFLTRAQAARRARIPAGLLVYRPDLLTVSGRWLPEVYFAFQFDEHGVLPDLGSVVQSLKGRYTDIEIADWLVRPNRSLGFASPLRFLNGRGAVERVVGAADAEGPVVSDKETAERLRPEPELGDHTVPNAATRARRPVWRPASRPPAYGSR